MDTLRSVDSLCGVTSNNKNANKKQESAKNSRKDNKKSTIICLWKSSCRSPTEDLSSDFLGLGV